MSEMKLTNSGRWDYAWYSSLPTELKLLIVYVEDKSDLAAVWAVNKGLAEYHIGARIDWGLALEAYKGQVLPLAQGEKWYLKEVLARRCPAGLSERSSLHESVRRLLLLHQIPPHLWPGGGWGMPPRRYDSTSNNQTQDNPLPLSGMTSGEIQEGGPAPTADAKAAGNGDQIRAAMKRLRLKTSDPACLDELTAMCREIGVPIKVATIIDMLDWSVPRARKAGLEVRFARHFEAFARQWVELQPTVKIKKESA